MFNSGIYTQAQYLALGERRRYSAARVAYNLLDVGDNPGATDIRTFEDICFTLRTSNGTFRTTFRNRFRDLDAVVLRRLRQSFDSPFPIRVQDRAVSSGLTSAEWAGGLFEAFPAARFEASDLLVELMEWSPGNGETFIVEPNGKPLQYIRPPFVVSLDYPESWRNPLLRFVADRARRRFERLSRADCRIRTIHCTHPEARALCRTNPNFRFEVRSVFDRTPGACEAMRTMNILNLSYFSPEQLEECARAIFESVTPGGIWIVGRTLEEDFSNHATLFRRGTVKWEVLERMGRGSEIEELALRLTP